LGSSLSLRSFGRVGSSVSVHGFARLGSVFSMSVLDFLHLGSSLSLRSFGRLGSSVSVLGLARFAALSVSDKVEFGQNSYIRYDGSSSIEARVGNSRGLSITSSGGTLHGVWSSDNVISASDRRLKKDIAPLGRTLAEEMRHARGDDEVPDAGSKAERSEAVTWMLRELRPVSFSFRRGPESKFARYGFVAQEVERVLPSVVREKDTYKHVLYQDLIALLTLTAQAQNARLEALEQQLAEQSQRLAQLEDLPRKVAALEKLLEVA
jgi:hypothetical protein